MVGDENKEAADLWLDGQPIRQVHSVGNSSGEAHEADVVGSLATDVAHA